MAGLSVVQFRNGAGTFKLPVTMPAAPAEPLDVPEPPKA